jgi:hypothetical protein
MNGAAQPQGVAEEPPCEIPVLRGSHSGKSHSDRRCERRCGPDGSRSTDPSSCGRHAFDSNWSRLPCARRSSAIPNRCFPCKAVVANSPRQRSGAREATQIAFWVREVAGAAVRQAWGRGWRRGRASLRPAPFIRFLALARGPQRDLRGASARARC